MPTTTWSDLRNEIARETGYVSFTSDDITTTTVVASSLANRVGGRQDDLFIGWYVLVEEGTNAGERRFIRGFAADTGTLTISGDNLTADATARACSLHRFDPIDLQAHFNEARKTLFPSVCILRDDRSLVTGQRQFRFNLPSTLRGRPLQVFLGQRDTAKDLSENVLSNPGFADWTSGSPDDWTLSGAGSSVSEETQTSAPRNYAVLGDDSSALIKVAANTATTLLQSVSPSVATEGMEVNLGLWVYCLTESRVSARISGSNVNSSPVDGTKHGGTGWERLTVTATLDDSATGFDAGVAITSGAAIALYADEAICVVGQSEAADRAWVLLYQWRWVGPVGGASNNGYLEFSEILPEQRRLRVIGRDLISSVSADTDTVEVDGEVLEVLYNETRRRAVLDRLLWLPVQERRFWQAKANEYSQRVNTALVTGVGTVRTPNPTVQVPY